MFIRNLTPFLSMAFQGRDRHNKDVWVILLRGTFRIVDRRRLELAPTQHPIVVTDTFVDQAFSSSLYLESDLLPYKAKTDIYIHGHAWAPRGQSLAHWMVRACVGTLQKSLRVTGPRFWSKQGDSMVLSKPEPTHSVPIRYEQAFGGPQCHENPVGCGHISPEDNMDTNPRKAPQIEDPKDPILEWTKIYKPQGFGPITRSWLPRRALAGTFDETWKKERWPEMPDDFNIAYYNSAHPDLVYEGYLQGGERVVLENLHPQGTIEFSVPNERIGMLATLRDLRQGANLLKLDTLVIDIPQELVHCTWRVQINVGYEIRAIDLMLQQKKGG